MHYLLRILFFLYFPLISTGHEKIETSDSTKIVLYTEEAPFIQYQESQLQEITQRLDKLPWRTGILLLGGCGVFGITYAFLPDTILDITMNGSNYYFLSDAEAYCSIQPPYFYIIPPQSHSWNTYSCLNVVQNNRIDCSSTGNFERYGNTTNFLTYMQEQFGANATALRPFLSACLGGNASSFTSRNMTSHIIAEMTCLFSPYYVPNLYVLNLQRYMDAECVAEEARQTIATIWGTLTAFIIVGRFV